MPRGHAQVSYTDLLITMDYLLRKTGIDRPANTLEMCRYARDEFGLVYQESENGSAGNQVKHTRFKQCIDFLFEVQERHPGALPFVLKRNASRKAYVESKFGFGEEDIMKLLMAVKNDRYTSSEDADALIDNLIYLLVTPDKQSKVEGDMQVYSKQVQRVEGDTRTKLDLVIEARRSGRILVIFKDLEENGRIVKKRLNCRVYNYVEYRNQTYVTLIAVNEPLVLFEAVANLEIHNPPLMEDDERDLERALREERRLVSPLLRGLYRPRRPDDETGGPTISFSYEYKDHAIVEGSFRNHFGHSLRATRCAHFFVQPEGDSFRLCPDPRLFGGEARYCVANLALSPSAFLSWLISDPKGKGDCVVADYVDVASPRSLNEDLAKFFQGRYAKYERFLPDRDPNQQ